MRNLATVQLVDKLVPIPGAERIELVTLVGLGWQCVVKKGDFQEAEKGVYIEVDSIVPNTPDFEFMKDRKYRVKTIKLRGQVSQGLFLPLSYLPERKTPYLVGEDVSSILEVRKYDPEGDLEKKLLEQKEKATNSKLEKFLLKHSFLRKIFLPKKSKGMFPSFIKKTDEERIQKCPHMLNEGTFYEVTEKLDGQSGTYFLVKNDKWWQFWNKEIFGVCSRNIYLHKKDTSNYWKVAEKYPILETLQVLLKTYNAKSVVIQGEIIGEGIQGNKYNRILEFYVFNVVIDGKRYSPFIFEDFELMRVPLLYAAKKIRNMEEAITLSTAFSTLENYLSEGTLREGIVCRDIQDNAISFKVISPEFLLKWGL